jgi:DNA-binding GntR family transcriptional regulator
MQEAKMDLERTGRDANYEIQQRIQLNAWLHQTEVPVADVTSTHADRVFDAIENAMITGDIPLGCRLGEEALSRRLGVSRGTLREALRRLEGRGLVERLPRAGVRVVQMSLADLVELYEIRESIEGMACRLAAQRMSVEEIQHLRKLLLRFEDTPQPSDKPHHGWLDFHFLIAKASRSRRLEQILCQDLYSLIRLCRLRIAARSVARLERAQKDHLRILDAIEERDGELAEILMRRHVAAARNDLGQQYIQTSRHDLD